MEQELVVPIKRVRGRPRKPENELSAKTLANRQTEENRLARIARSRGLEEQFKREAELLRTELNSYPMNERSHAESLIEQGYSLLRDIAYDRKSIQLLETEEIVEIWESQENMPPDQWIHMPGFVDATANEIVWNCQQVRLTPALARFEIKVLEAVLDWAVEHPDNFEHRSVLEKELNHRIGGVDYVQAEGRMTRPNGALQT